jgi:hypothetical protein
VRAFPPDCGLRVAGLLVQHALVALEGASRTTPGRDLLRKLAAIEVVMKVASLVVTPVSKEAVSKLLALLPLQQNVKSIIGKLGEVRAPAGRVVRAVACTRSPLPTLLLCTRLPAVDGDDARCPRSNGWCACPFFLTGRPASALLLYYLFPPCSVWAWLLAVVVFVVREIGPTDCHQCSRRQQRHGCCVGHHR